METNFNNNEKLSSDNETPPIANVLLAADLLSWLKDERNILLNTGSMMWHKPEEQKLTIDVGRCLDKAIQYIELSKICT
jgi:hypothetical protein